MTISIYKLRNTPIESRMTSLITNIIFRKLSSPNIYVLILLFPPSYRNF